MMHQSIATIDSPEFINLQPLEMNPLMSSCEIKVLYLGENRNHSYITKEVATEMAKTLRGAPIVGYYKEEKEDFRDHGEKVILDDEGIKFECLTKPYGFVAPDAQVWFQKFEDVDEFGNKEVREYLMTTGYLWTGQYEEAKLAIEGRPQSMELDSESLDGHWATNNKTGMDFFIINDAIFSKLCILGEDVEPCFEGARISAPEVSKTFSKMDDSFKTTLFTMMKDLKSVLKGGYQMELDEKETLSVDAENVEETVENNEVETEVTTEEEVNEVETENVEEEVQEEEIETEEENVEEEEETVATEDYAALENELNELKDKFSALEKQYNELVSFKEAVDNEKKDALINSFYMLSDEDKKEVIEHKAEYSLDDIEAKLSVICVRKKVNFEKEDTSKNDNDIENPVTTFSLNEENSVAPAWLAALKRKKEEKNNNK